MKLGWARVRGAPIATIAGGLAWLVAAILLLYRLPYGVSNRDEAFYSAIPYSFLLGNRPYVDELALHQNAGLLLVPFYKLYVAVVGSADGIILFNRRLYFVCVAVCSLATYRFVSRLVGRSTACWAAALVLTFSYCNLFAVSYNTVGAFGLFLGSLCAAQGVRAARPGRSLFVASLFFLVAVFAYPGLAVAVLPYAALVIAWLYRRAPRAALRSGLLGLAAGFAVALAVGIPLTIWIGKSGFQHLVCFSRSMGYVTQTAFEKLNFFHSDAWRWHRPLFGFMALFALLPFACRSFGRGSWLVALGAMAWCGVCYRLSQHTDAPNPAMIFLMAVPVLTPVCVALNHKWPHARFVLELIWAPSVLSMAATTYSSANGFYATSLGALGALVAGVTSLAGYLQTLAERNPKLRVGHEVVLRTFCLSCWLVHVHSLFAAVYDDEPAFRAHDTRVSGGPFRGAIATRSEAARLVAVDADLKRLAGSASSLTVFDGFATGYLSTRLKPLTFTQWIVWCMTTKYDRQIMQETFGGPGRLPDLVLEIGMKPTARRLWEKYERGHYHAVVVRHDFQYVILQRNKD
ncbi:MAG TPA: hypothetical protein VK745_20785 [Polyangiaceae bacterium]|jgi:hypothetical protein|nr:hypothetical protein [Polyangiaceae bacterium]